MPTLSAVIPVYNEVASLNELHAELRAVAAAEGYDLDLIFVDDGSSDGSWQAIQQLARSDAQVRGVRFRRNFGKAAALSAGFSAARGETVVTLDADLQDDPREIPRLLAELARELDVVSGWKRVRHDPWHKVWPSRMFNWLCSALTGVRLHDHNCGMKCYRREVLGEVRLYGEFHRFVPVLAAARGFRVGEIAIAHRPRKYGRSKYGAGRLMRGFLDLLTVKFLTGYGRRPQHMLGAAGLIFAALGAATLAYCTGYWLRCVALNEDPKLHQRPALIYGLGSLLLGIQLLSIGLLAELITAYQVRDADTYSIAERTDEPDEAGAGQ